MPALTWADVGRLLDAGMTAEAERLALRLVTRGSWARDPIAVEALGRLAMAFVDADGYRAVRREIGVYEVTLGRRSWVVKAGTGAEAVAQARRTPPDES